MSDNNDIAFEKGKVAFHKGWLNCPYRDKSQFHREWTRGFNRAYFDHKIVVESQERAGYKAIVRPGHFSRLYAQNTTKT